MDAARPGELVGMDSFCLGRLSGRKGAVWQLERVLSENEGEYRAQTFRETLEQLGARHTFIRAPPAR